MIHTPVYIYLAVDRQTFRYQAFPHPLDRNSDKEEVRKSGIERKQSDSTNVIISERVDAHENTRPLVSSRSK